MYIERIQIENIRGFESVDLDLTRPDGSYAGWTVLAGRNGSGKSTLLRAIALAVTGPPDVKALQESFADWLRRGTQRGETALSLQPPWHARDLGSISLGLSWHSYPESLSEPMLSFDIVKRKRSETEILVRGPWNPSFPQSSSPWFLAGYGPFRRLTGHGKDAQRLMSGPDRLARLASLFREDASLVVLEALAGMPEKEAAVSLARFAVHGPQLAAALDAEGVRLVTAPE